MQTPRPKMTTTGRRLFAVAAPILLLAAAAAGQTTVPLHTAGAVTSPVTIDYRWQDTAQNAYAPAYVDGYGYDDATVTLTYETGEPTFVGHLSAAGLKPNFAYQIKIVGKPTGLFTPEQGGDDAANERIGYAGRWWEVTPSPGNRTDSYYETYKDEPGYVFEAYLLFDFFITDRWGAAEVDFALDSSYHVLFWDWQRTQGACDNPLKTAVVTGQASDPAYSAAVGPTPVGVYPQIERLCDGTTALPTGVYNCRFLLTEESFHSGYGNWAPAMINDDLVFTIDAGLFPPSPTPEPAYTAGLANTVAWGAVAGATEYLVQRADDAAFTTGLVDSGWIAGTSHQFTGLTDGQAYHYRVKAGDGLGGESSWSGAVSSTQDATAPVSALDVQPPTRTSSSFDLPWTASDAVAGIASVRLYYRVDGGAYAQYDGPFTSSPIDFVAPVDGAYDFYIVATDNAGNVEAAPSVPDASTLVDTSAGEPTAQDVVLAATATATPDVYDLDVGYDLSGGAVTAAVGWYRDGVAEMRLYLPMEGGAAASLKDYAAAGGAAAVATGDPLWIADAGPDGFGAYAFDGDDGLEAGAVLPTGASYSKTAWVRRTGSGAGGGNGIVCGDADAGGHALWAPDAQGNRLGAGHDGDWNAVQDPDPLPLDAWTFVAVTYDAATGQMILYRDGAEVDRATVASAPSDADVAIGSRGAVNGDHWLGLIDDVRIYGRALGPDQIAVLHGAGGRDIVAAAETAPSEIWQASVTPFSATAAGARVLSNTLTVGANGDSFADAYVDIGNPASEAGHALVGWGPVEPDAHGGGWGGIAGESPPGKCRTIWSPSEATTVENWASLEIDFGTSPAVAKSLGVRYLDGGSDDSFNILIDDTLFHWIYAPPGTETWRWVRIDVTGLTGVHTLKFEATAGQGTFFNPYGQVGIDKVHVGTNVTPVPVNPSPSAVEVIDCGGTQVVNLHFSQDRDDLPIRGYTVRLTCPEHLSFDSGDIAVNVLPAGLPAGEYTVSVAQEAGAGPNDWTVDYMIPGGTTGIPADKDLFAVTVHGDSEGQGPIDVESLVLWPVSGGAPPLATHGAGRVTVDCAAPTGSFAIDGGAAATGSLDVSLDSDVADVSALQMRFSNDGTWADAETGWVDYAPAESWTLEAGGDGPRTVYAEYRDQLGRVLPLQDTIDLDVTGLDAVTGLVAESGRDRVRVAWQFTGDPGNEVELWRAMWYGAAAPDTTLSAYPEYDDLPEDWLPGRPADRAAAAAPGSGWHLIATLGSATTEYEDFPNPPLGLRRGLYRYEVFVSDTVGGYSDPAPEGARATSYLLGDVGAPAAPYAWDGAITVDPDINTLGLAYGTALGHPSWNPHCDVGPTDDFGGAGAPATDDAVDFQDLMIFALNYDVALAKAPAASGGPEAVLAWSRAGDGRWSLSLVEPCRNLKGLRLSAAVPGAAVAAGGLLGAQSGPCFVRNIPERGLDAGLALLGGGLTIAGAGELLRVDLRGAPPAAVAIEARGADNRPLAVRIATDGGRSPAPAAYRLLPNHPNPFNPATLIEFSLPERQRVRLTIHALDGRRVATLLDAPLPAGDHALVWNGRGDGGRGVASGVYVYRIEAGDFVRARKMTLLK